MGSLLTKVCLYFHLFISSGYLISCWRAKQFNFLLQQQIKINAVFTVHANRAAATDGVVKEDNWPWTSSVAVSLCMFWRSQVTDPVSSCSVLSMTNSQAVRDAVEWFTAWSLLPPPRTPCCAETVSDTLPFSSQDMTSQNAVVVQLKLAREPLTTVESLGCSRTEPSASANRRKVF